MSKFLKIFLIVVFFVFSFISNIEAAGECFAYSIDPPAGSSSTSFTLKAEGCPPGITYRLSMAFESKLENPISANGVSNQSGLVEITLAPTVPGEYHFWFGESISIDFFYDGVVSVTEPEEDADPIVYTCGSTGLPDKTTTCGDGVSGACCPSACPWGYITQPGTTSSYISMCVCGVAGAACCPGSSPCGNETLFDTFCNENNICETADADDIILPCGAEIPTEAPPGANIACEVACPAGQKENGIPWCACGTSGGACCSTGTPCQDENQICKQGSSPTGYCGYPDPEPKPANIPQCDAGGGSTGLFTAFGCIDYSLPQNVAGALLKFAIPFIGGIAIILIAYAAFLYMTSAGNPKQVEMAKEVLVSALAGATVVALSVWLMRVIGVDVLGLFG